MMGNDQVREDAYIRHLQGKISDDQIELRVKHNEIRRRPAKVEPPLPKKIFVAVGLAAVALLGLTLWSFVNPAMPQADPEIQLEVNEWARSSVRMPIYEYLRDVKTSVPAETINSTYLGGDRWSVSGSVVVVDQQGESRESRWTSEIEYSPEAKTGDVATLFLDDELIYSNNSVASVN